MPNLAVDLGIAPGLAAGAIIAAFHSLALFVEAPLLAWAERGRVRTVSSIALGALAAAIFLAAFAPSSIVLLLALALYGPASGVALAASEGLLVESRPEQRERTMARLTLAGTLGDLAVPALLAALAWAGLGWREATFVAGLSALLLALVVARSRELDRPMSMLDEDADAPGHDVEREHIRHGEEVDPRGARPPLRELRHGVRTTPALVGWSLAAPGIALLDETLLAFAIVHLDAHAGASVVERSFAIAGSTVGALLGLVVLERCATRVRPGTILAAAIALVVPALVVLAWTRSATVAIVALTLVGAGSATFHPITQARAYASLPGRPAMVNAVGRIVAPLDAILPLALAYLAFEHGSFATMLALVCAPLAIGLIALGTGSR